MFHVEQKGDPMDYLSRDEAIKRIRAGLKARRANGDPTWSVTGGKGTAWGWITIDAPPSARTYRHVLDPGSPDRYEFYREVDSHKAHGHASPALRARLAELLGLPVIHQQGVSIPASNDYYQEYVARAEGRTPERLGTPYWD